jgi:hypothetical protein
MTFTIRLVAKNEGLLYSDESAKYYFDVVQNGEVWTVFLPCAKGSPGNTYALSKSERSLILPRIVDYLKEIKWFGIFQKRYEVNVIEKSPM